MVRHLPRCYHSGDLRFSSRWATLMLVRAQPSTPSWATRKYQCLPRQATPSISRYVPILRPSTTPLPSACHVHHNLPCDFQTLYVEPGLCLCDCPGLVMPSFVSTKAEMICSGILPIDQMRDHVPPVSLISFLFQLHLLMYVRALGVLRALPSNSCMH